MFGTLWKTDIVTRVVLCAVSSHCGSGKQTFLIVDWSIHGVQRVKEVKLVNVKVFKES